MTDMQEPPPHDICVVGHVTRDWVQTAAGGRSAPGGTGYYAALAAAHEGARVALVTGLARHDAPLLQSLTTAGVSLACRWMPRTTVFENRYGLDPDQRCQRVRSLAEPFCIEDVAAVRAAVVHLGPLTDGDIPAAVADAVAGRARMTADLQGLVRRVAEDGNIELQAPGRPIPWLSKLWILKAEEAEACALTREASAEKAAAGILDAGVAEVVITLGSRGAFVAAGSDRHWIPAVPPRHIVDPTGCGDTFMAVYLFHRMKSKSVTEAGALAAAAASRKLGVFGPLR